LIEGNNYETWQNSLLYFIFGNFGVDPAQNLAKYRKWFRVACEKAL